MAKNNKAAWARTGLALLACLCALVTAAAWPTKPVRIVVPYAPGAINDVLARHMADRLQVLPGQPVIVENRAGGGAVIGTQAVASALAAPALRAALAAEGVEPVGTPPAQFSAYVRLEIPLWASIIRKGNIRSD